MLFDVTALLSTSAALGPAAEAFGAPKNAEFSAVSGLFDGTAAAVNVVAGVAGAASGDSLPPITTNGNSVDPGAIVHGVPVTLFQVSTPHPAEIRTLTGIAFVRGLAGLSAEQIDKIVSTDPAAITRALDSAPSASDVGALWQSMDAATRSKLATSAPRLVGNLSGVPVDVRNTANRLWVTEQIRLLKTTTSTATGRALAETDQQQLSMLGRVQAALKSSRNGPARSLLSLDMSGSGKAVIVLGDLQTASYVTYMVPGMFYTVDGQLGAWTTDAARLYAQQVSWMNRLSSVSATPVGKSVAVVSWMGYQTPNLTNVASLQLATQASGTLAGDIEAMQTLRTGNEPYTTIIAHSYGSTAALMSLTNYDYHVNAAVLVGTPGSAAQSVTDLHVDHGNVWVGAAPWDPVPTSAFFGSDPSAASYGAHKLGVSGGVDPITGDELQQSVGHNEYFDAGTESVRNMALISIDQAQLALHDDAADATRTLADAR